MKAGEKPQFDSAWWTKNKAKALSKDTALDKALAAFEKAFAEFRKDSIDKDLTELSKALDALPPIIAATIKKCNSVLQKETIECLKKFDPLIKNLQRDIRSELSRRKKIDAMTLPDCAFGAFKKEFADLAKANFDSDSLNYYVVPALKGGKAGTAKEFERFLWEGSKEEINIINPTRLKFCALADVDPKALAAMSSDQKKKMMKTPRKDLSKGPWKEVYDEIETLLKGNLMKNFRKELRLAKWRLASLR